MIQIIVPWTTNRCFQRWFDFPVLVYSIIEISHILLESIWNGKNFLADVLVDFQLLVVENCMGFEIQDWRCNLGTIFAS